MQRRTFTIKEDISLASVRSAQGKGNDIRYRSSRHDSIDLLLSDVRTSFCICCILDGNT